MLIVKNTIESPAEQAKGLKANVDRIVHDQYGGDIYAYVKSLVDQIDILENELKNKINEFRLFENDVREILKYDYECVICGICSKDHLSINEEPCCSCMNKPYFAWRGPQEEANDI